MASSSEGGGTSSGGGGGGGASGTFRERRLSLAQQADPSAKGAARNRRLSIYDREEELQGGVNAFGAPVSTCGCKSVGGLEPVPGGSTAKINQDRALAVYPFMGEKVSSGPLHLPLVALGKRWWHAVQATCHPSPRSHPQTPPSPLALALTRRAASSACSMGMAVSGRRYRNSS